ncbi:MAG: tRNA adenosine(34) deaminase TadA [Acidimicrobiaceae bacterium]
MGVLTPDDFTTGELDTWMSRALEEARAAESHGDVPVGAVVVHRNSVIAARHNERQLTGDPTSHAEVLALRDAANVIGNWHLEECLLIVTLEPCVMCAGAMVNSRLGMLVFGAHDPKAGAAGSCFNLTNSDVLNHRIPQIAGVRSEESSQLLKRFFADRRR